MKKKTIQPPKWATRFLSFYCRPELLEDLQGDLNEFFQRNLEAKGASVARLNYVIDVLKFFRLYTVRKPKVTNPFRREVMLASYAKTSGRMILRNKLFSGINIIGLAFSMSVGLLAIALVSDLYSYDSALKNKDRIYRVYSTIANSGQPPMKLATTSWKSGYLVRQEIPGVESIAFLRRGFDGDANTGSAIVPVSGMYANEGFFDVFSFPLLKGVAATALKEPHSLVLTQVTAKKLFGNADPMGKVVRFDSVNYTVTGLMEDLPKLSHMQFEMLVSLSSIDPAVRPADGEDYMDWHDVYANYVYVLLSRHTQPAAFTAALDRLDERENAASKDRNILLSLQPVTKIAVGKPMGNEIGTVFNIVAFIILCGLAAIIILSACFNYTNLSIARSLRRSREVGIRKVIGAQRRQVIGQFIAESVIISLLSLCFAFLIFLLLRSQFLSLNYRLDSTFSLLPTPRLIAYFILLAVVVGVISGLLPALFYSKINTVQVLKDASSLKVFRHISLRKGLIVTQYTFSLIFITAVIIGYNQYKGFLRFDLGFSTDNILNIDMQGNKSDVFVKELSALPSVQGVSKSVIVSSLGSIFGAGIKYRDPLDSAQVDLNDVDEHYLPLHKYQFLAGRNFTPQVKDSAGTETIVNEQLLKRFNIGHGNPERAIGEVVRIAGNNLTIVGVLRDFHYGTLEQKIDPTAFRYNADPGRFVNVKITGSNITGTMTSIWTLWKQMDKVHPLDAKFYNDQIIEAYSQFPVILKVIGFFALLAVCISSLGLFGMVIYTMEKRMKEISIRKVLGAGEGLLMYLLSKGFLVLLLIAALIALPLTWIFFDKVVLASFAYHQPIHFGDMFTGLFLLAGAAIIMIVMQTLKIVRANPAKVLKEE